MKVKNADKDYKSILNARLRKTCIGSHIKMASETAEGEILQFVPFVSRLGAGFWHELGHKKLEEYKLSEEHRQLHGYYTNCKLTPS